MDFESNGCAFESRQAHRRDILIKGEIEKIKEGEERAQPKGYGEMNFPIASFSFRSGGIVGKGEAPLSRERKRRLRVSAKKHGGQVRQKIWRTGESRQAHRGDILMKEGVEENGR